MFFEMGQINKGEYRLLNESLRDIDFRDKDFKTYIQIVTPHPVSDEVKDLGIYSIVQFLIYGDRSSIDGRKKPFYNNRAADSEIGQGDWALKKLWKYAPGSAIKLRSSIRKQIKSLRHMRYGALSGVKAQLTYTILGFRNSLSIWVN